MKTAMILHSVKAHTPIPRYLSEQLVLASQAKVSYEEWFCKQTAFLNGDPESAREVSFAFDAPPREPSPPVTMDPANYPPAPVPPVPTEETPHRTEKTSGKTESPVAMENSDRGEEDEETSVDDEPMRLVISEDPMNDDPDMEFMLDQADKF